MIEPTVETLEPLDLVGPDVLVSSELMSPFVWRLQDGRYAILVRVVPGSKDDNCTGRIWYGEGEDGLRFQMDSEPVLVPSPGGPDAGGCEDPTLLTTADGVIVFYSGVNVEGRGSLLWASGPDVRELEKHGIAHHGFAHEENVKEAEVGFWGDRWSLSYEFARNDASIIGLAEGDSPIGPWRKRPLELNGRPGRWDDWHLSTGALVPNCFGRHVMFYNGATRDAVWAVGWFVFDPDREETIARSEEPLITPPGEEGGRNMAFSSSCVMLEDRLHLYLSLNDRQCCRALIRWPAEPGAIGEA